MKIPPETEAAQPRTPEQTGQEFWREQLERSESRSTGCLIAAGIVGALILIPLMVAQAVSHTLSLVDYVEAHSGQGFLMSVEEWLSEANSERDKIEGFLGLGGFGFCVLVWQWMTFRYRWPGRIFGEHLLWAISSLYLVLIMVAFAYLTWEGSPGPGLNAFYAFNDWFLATAMFSVIPGVCLAFTASLWRIARARRAGESPTDTPGVD